MNEYQYKNVIHKASTKSFFHFKFVSGCLRNHVAILAS